MIASDGWIKLLNWPTHRTCRRLKCVSVVFLILILNYNYVFLWIDFIKKLFANLTIKFFKFWFVVFFFIKIAERSLVDVQRVYDNQKHTASAWELKDLKREMVIINIVIWTVEINFFFKQRKRNWRRLRRLDKRTTPIKSKRTKRLLVNGTPVVNVTPFKCLRRGWKYDLLFDGYWFVFLI